MKARVQVACPSCGPLDVDAARITVFRRLDEIDAMYRFDCTECSATVTRHATPDHTAALLRAGAHVELRPSLADDVVIVLSDEAEISTDTSS